MCALTGYVICVLPTTETECVKMIDLTVDNELWHVITNNVVCANSKVSDHPAHMRSLIKNVASGLTIMLVLIY